ncbi:MAG TPA: patatin-like phospholipase family protein [Chitinophagaceae bacterium]
MKRVVVLAILGCILSFSSFSQQTYRNLVLEGGGVRGFAYAGAMQVLDSLGILQQIERVGGTSAGAIQATMLAIGYTPAEIAAITSKVPLKTFNDGSLTGGLSRMQRKFGFYKGEKLQTWIENLILEKTGDANISFIQLHQQKSEKGYKDLYITGTDLSYRCLRVFSYETYPSMRIKDALRISFSIPLYFQPVLINDQGEILADRTDTAAHLMVDGGLLSNYPIHLFDNGKYTDCPGGEMHCYNMETLGLLLEKPNQLSYRIGSEAPLQINTLNEYFSAVYKTLIDRPNPDEPGLNRTITISDLGLSGRVRKLPQATINRLIESGKEGVRKFFNSSSPNGNVSADTLHVQR